MRRIVSGVTGASPRSPRSRRPRPRCRPQCRSIPRANRGDSWRRCEPPSPVAIRLRVDPVDGDHVLDEHAELLRALFIDGPRNYVCIDQETAHVHIYGRDRGPARTPCLDREFRRVIVVEAVGLDVDMRDTLPAPARAVARREFAGAERRLPEVDPEP